MKIPSSLTKLLAAVASTLALGACHRAEYAALPASPSYYDNAPRHHAPATPQHSVAVAPAAEASPVSPVPVPTSPASPSRVAPVAKAASAVAAAEKPVAAAPAAEVRAATRPSLMQRVVAHKITRKLDKLAAAPIFKAKSPTASTQRVNGKLRQGLILLLVGLLLGILAGAVGGAVGNLVGLVGLVFVIIGIVLLILYLLDEL